MTFCLASGQTCEVAPQGQIEPSTFYQGKVDVSKNGGSDRKHGKA